MEAAPPELLTVAPTELAFDVTQNKSAVTHLNLRNLHPTTPIAYKIKTTNPARYLVRPNVGVVWAQGASTVTVNIPEMKNVPTDAVKCKDKFQVLTLAADERQARLLLDASAVGSDALRAKLNELWASETAQHAWVNKIHSVLRVARTSIRGVSIPEERPLSPGSAPTPVLHSHSAAEPATPAELATSGQAAPPTLAASEPAAIDAPRPPPPATSASATPLASAAEEPSPASSSIPPPPRPSSLPPATSVAAVDEQAPAAAEKSRTPLEGGSAEPYAPTAFGAVAVGSTTRPTAPPDGETSELRSMLEASESMRRAMRAQMARALSEYEAEREMHATALSEAELAHGRKVSELRSELAAERENSARLQEKLRAADSKAAAARGAPLGMLSQAPPWSGWVAAAVMLLAMLVRSWTSPALASTSDDEAMR